MAGPGGRIAPDGRPAQAPGVGKNARRHDLEAPATPGLSNSDLQQGDVQRLEQAQKIAPRPKRQQGAASAQPRQRPPQRAGSAAAASGGMQVPDPIQFASGKIGGQAVSPGQGGMRQVDPMAWMPLAEMMAQTPNAGGTIVSSLFTALQGFNRRPVVSELSFVDFDEMDRAIGGQ